MHRMLTVALLATFSGCAHRTLSETAAQELLYKLVNEKNEEFLEASLAVIESVHGDAYQDRLVFNGTSFSIDVPQGIYEENERDNETYYGTLSVRYMITVPKDTRSPDEIMRAEYPQGGIIDSMTVIFELRQAHEVVKASLVHREPRKFKEEKLYETHIPRKIRYKKK